MPQTRECDYCGSDIEPGTGTMFVQKDGSTTHFCSSKCENNADLGREARNLGWTESGYNASGEKQTDEETAAAEEEEADAAPDLEAAEEDVEGDEDADEGDDEDEEEAEEAQA